MSRPKSKAWIHTKFRDLHNYDKTKGGKREVEVDETHTKKENEKRVQLCVHSIFAFSTPPLHDQYR